MTSTQPSARFRAEPATPSRYAFIARRCAEENALHATGNDEADRRHRRLGSSSASRRPAIAFSSSCVVIGPVNFFATLPSGAIRYVVGRPFGAPKSCGGVSSGTFAIGYLHRMLDEEREDIGMLLAAEREPDRADIAAAGDEVRDVRHFLDAGRAPGRPEIHDDPFAALAARSKCAPSSVVTLSAGIFAAVRVRDRRREQQPSRRTRRTGAVTIVSCLLHRRIRGRRRFARLPDSDRAGGGKISASGTSRPSRTSAARRASSSRTWTGSSRREHAHRRADGSCPPRRFPAG